MEEWKVVPGTYDTIEVSNLGRVKSLKSGEPRILKGQKDQKGYIRISITNRGVGKTYKVHRLVAQAFLPTPSEDRNQVNHIDGNKANNNVSNLEWVSNKENVHHAIANGLWDTVIEGSTRASEAKRRPVMATKNHIILAFDSVGEAERWIGSRHITDVLKGKRQHVKGWNFSYIERG